MGRTAKPRKVQRKVQKRQAPTRHYYAADKKKSTTCKRAISPYLAFMQSCRNYLMKKNRPIPSVTEFAKICSQKWQNMSESLKAPFKAYAAVDLERYQEEKKAAAKVVVKRPMSAFLQFYIDIRPRLVSENPGCSVSVLSRMAGEKWRECSEAKKNTYKRKARDAMVAYKRSNQ